MAKVNKKRISQRAAKVSEVPAEEPSVFLSVPIKSLPKDMQKRHNVREKKIDANREENSKLFKEGEADIKKLIASIKASKDGK